MQFIIVEWEVYSLTKDPLSLGLIGLVEVIPAISTALFAGHIVDQREKKMLFVLTRCNTCTTTDTSCRIKSLICIFLWYRNSVGIYRVSRGVY